MSLFCKLRCSPRCAGKRSHRGHIPYTSLHFLCFRDVLQIVNRSHYLLTIPSIVITHSPPPCSHFCCISRFPRLCGIVMVLRASICPSMMSSNYLTVFRAFRDFNRLSLRSRKGCSFRKMHLDHFKSILTSKYEDYRKYCQLQHVIQHISVEWSIHLRLPSKLMPQN